MQSPAAHGTAGPAATEAVGAAAAVLCTLTVAREDDTFAGAGEGRDLSSGMVEGEVASLPASGIAGNDALRCKVLPRNACGGTGRVGKICAFPG